VPLPLFGNTTAAPPQKYPRCRNRMSLGRVRAGSRVTKNYHGFFPTSTALYPRKKDCHPECVMIILFPVDRPLRTGEIHRPGRDMHAHFSRGLTGGEGTNGRSSNDPNFRWHLRNGHVSHPGWRMFRDRQFRTNNRRDVVDLTYPFFSCRFFAPLSYQDRSEYPVR
jgi:hypothetical protein